ncbi:hypothetical protein [Streptomyces javensis]|uniref:Uncharacterized protein n=1 Tax=Streptomyces javensis TaxID=114698 RepID=A0ABS0RRN2_9ACTN|nr:hypothetical protein [Streptomyces javensis]MBI0319479.1 hypothetical protein [Streptomyces javensis]
MEATARMGQRWVALVDRGNGCVEACDIVEWLPDGAELVGYICGTDDAAQGDKGRVVRADRHPGFLTYERRPQVVGALPGMGWTVCYRLGAPPPRGGNGTSGAECLERRPVLAWLVYDDGTVTPCDVDHDGLVYCSTDTPELAHVEPPAPASDRQP